MPATRITLEPTKQVTAAQELALVRAAYARNPTPRLRSQLAGLLLYEDDSAGVIALLAGRDGLDASDELRLANAWIAAETPEGDREAAAAAARAADAAADARTRAAGLALVAKARTRQGDTAAARALLADALALDPHNPDACKRLAALDLAAGDAPAVIALCERLAALGVAHARLHGARALAHARLGQVEAARATIGSDAFLADLVLAPPPGWDTIEAFNAAVAAELVAHPGLRFERYGSASERTWRIDAPLHRSAPLTRLLMERIAAAISAHIDRVAGADHPWAAARPDDALLRCWSVITESDGFETWHVHQFGWLSGAYYVRVPDTIASGTDEAGCIAFGLPEDLAGEDAAAAYGTRVVRPVDGRLLMFPSHTYHRTFPHGLRDRRICVAFDLKPYPAASMEARAAA
jgi:hypothetical protein